MSRKVAFTRVALGLALLLTRANDLAAAESPSPAVTVDGAVTGLVAPASGLAAGGEAGCAGVTVSGSVRRQFGPAFSAALVLSGERQEWTLHDSRVFGGGSPWATLTRPSVGLALGLALSRSLHLRVTPSAEWAGAKDVSGADALTYGVTAGVFGVVTPRLVLGAGAKAQRQFYDVKTSPFLILNWQVRERLRIANAIGSGPLGGAGVEVRYAPDPRWELACGGVWRSDRWKLAASPTSDVVFEPSAVPLLARVSRTIDAKTRIDLYGGALFAGRLQLKDEGGHVLRKDTYGPAPLLALTLSRRL